MLKMKPDPDFFINKKNQVIHFTLMLLLSELIFLFAFLIINTLMMLFELKFDYLYIHFHH